jgi:DNA modification methylase
VLGMPRLLLLQSDARNLPLPDSSVDTVITSPPYFGLRSYTDGGKHYNRQIGSEATPAEFLDALIECTREMVRVLKPSGSILLNLGDKYSSGSRGSYAPDTSARRQVARRRPRDDAPPKSLLLIPERYRIRCVDELGLNARAVIIWSKPNGLPENVADRVQRSHEDWVHLTKQPRYYSAIDEIREPSDPRNVRPQDRRGEQSAKDHAHRANGHGVVGHAGQPLEFNSLGKLPGSVWEVVSQPLKVPDHVSHARCCAGRKRPGCEDGLDHYAAYPMEWPRRLIQGFSPREVCTACGDGRWPAVDVGTPVLGYHRMRTIKGYACACTPYTVHDDNTLYSKPWREYHTDTPHPPTTPGIVLDPFGGTGTTALVAAMHGRIGISVDASGDYCRYLARWRTTDPKERARAAGLDPDAVGKIRREILGQEAMFDLPHERGPGDRGDEVTGATHAT